MSRFFTGIMNQSLKVPPGEKGNTFKLCGVEIKIVVDETLPDGVVRWGNQEFVFKPGGENVK